ncbi:TRAP transporter permease [Thermodesulfobacteriota bacterium]
MVESLRQAAIPGAKRQRYKLVDIAFTVLAVAMVVYHLIASQYLIQGTFGTGNTHLIFALLIVFLSALRKADRLRWLWLAFMALSVAATGYVYLFADHLQSATEMGIVDSPDVFVGVILLLVVIAAGYLVYGKILTILTLIFVAYLGLGQYLPHFIAHGGFTLDRGLMELSLGMSSGVYCFIRVSVAYIFLFIVFGSVLQLSGASGFFMALAMAAGRKIRGGVAQTAVISSAMVGTISGSPIANVALTGSVTIPAMKRAGFRPEIAGAVEAAASTGGQIMPPVMGAAAFLMAAVSGVPYAKIMVVGFLPALLYFGSVGSYIYFESSKWRIQPSLEAVDMREIVLRAPLFLIPLGLMVYLLLSGHSAMYAAFWAITACFLLSLPRKATRPSWRRIIDGLVSGAEVGSRIAISCSLLGIIAISLIASGLALRVPNIIESLSGGNLVLALIFGFVAAVILGTGLHTSAVYLIVAITIVPGLMGMNVSLLSAHFFALYAGIISNVTPPVAVASLVASQIAESNFVRTAFQGLKIAAAGFILPFAFIWCRPLLGDFTNPSVDGLSLLSLAIGLVVCMQAAFAGHFLKSNTQLESGMLLAATVGFIGFSFAQNYILLGVGVAFMTIVIVWQLQRRRRER